MPIYEFKCRDCGETSEFLVSMNRGDFTPKCTNCGSESMEKVLNSSFAVIGGGGGSREEASCCGMTNPCDNPKRCCGR